MASSVFEPGTLIPYIRNIDKSDLGPPKPLMIVAPIVEGEYPVLVFLHGTSIECNFYSELLKFISSHGYIVVAPQLYCLMPPTGQTEINSACHVVNWLSQGLQSFLPEAVHPELNKLFLIGHSRGGKTAFSIILGHGQTSLPFTALIGLDPVAGISKCCQISPSILTHIPHSFNLGMPVMVIGTGLGDVRKVCCFPPCAPNGVNHKEFYNECQAPCYHFVTSEYGHMDMLNDETKGIMGMMCCMCKDGEGSRDPMRRCVGGLAVAFVMACLDPNKSVDFKAILEDPNIAPTKLDPVSYIES